MEFEIRGADDLLERLSLNYGLNDIRNVVKVNSSEFERNAKRSAPVDTGFLRRGIQLEIENGGMAARVTSMAEYSAYVEWGTRYQSAQPFMRPNFYPQTFKFMRDLRRLMK